MKKEKLLLLQYIRGIAAILVLIHHVALLVGQKIPNYEYLFGVFDFGYMGVDLFFILSGFIIYYIHQKDIGNKNKLRPFFLKRFIRIYPIYWVVLIPMVAIYYFSPSLGEGYERSFSAISQSFFLVPQEHAPILDVAWTLRHELYFYLLFGIIMIFISKRILSNTIIFVFMALSLILFILPNDNAWTITDFLFSPHNFEFLFGCLIAYFTSKYTFSLNSAKYVFGTGSVLFLFSWINEYFSYYEISRILAWGIPSSLLILGSVILDFKSLVKNNRLLLFLGDASFSIYLTHVPAIYLLIIVFNKINLFDTMGYFLASTLIVILSIIGGCVFYHSIEKPLLAFAKKIIFPKKQAAIITNDVAQN